MSTIKEAFDTLATMDNVFLIYCGSTWQYHVVVKVDDRRSLWMFIPLRVLGRRGAFPGRVFEGKSFAAHGLRNDILLDGYRSFLQMRKGWQQFFEIETRFRLVIRNPLLVQPFGRRTRNFTTKQYFCASIHRK